MTRPTRKTARNWLTIWNLAGKDGYGRVTYDAPYKVRCTFQRGGTRQYAAASGTLYVPASVFWYELPNGGTKPALNSFVALGDHTATANPIGVTGAETVKNAVLQDGAVLNDIPDVMVMT